MSNDTTIRISISNRIRLATIGKKDETFDDIVGKLLDTKESELAKKGVKING